MSAAAKPAEKQSPLFRHARYYAGVKRRISPPPRLGAMLTFDHHFPLKILKKQGSAPTARRRHYTPFTGHGVSVLTTTDAFRASAWPPPALRRPMTARHSRQIATQNRAPGRFEERKSWRIAREGANHIRQLVYWNFAQKFRGS